jgi:hypothetical protein
MRASATIPALVGKTAVSEAVADVAGEVLAFGIGGQEVTILLGWEVEVAVEFAAAKQEVKRALGSAVCG